jgi:hypothetical protein
MQALSQNKLETYDAATLRNLAVEQSQLLVVATKVIRKLEGVVEELTKELGAKNQKTLFAAQSLETMRRLHFGRKSECREGEDEDDSPLFSLFTQIAAAAGDEASSDHPKPDQPKPKIKRGRTPQPKLAERCVMHTIDAASIEARGLKAFDGQFEESTLITVVPSKLVIEKHQRQKYFEWDPENGTHKIVTADGPLKLKEASRYSIEFAVEVGLGKYRYHLPLDRQVHLLSEQGLNVSAQVLFEQTETVAWYLKSTLIKGIEEKIKAAPVNEADDTFWKNLESLKKRTKSSFFLWGVRNPEATLFSVYDARSQKVAADFLAGLEGVLLTDGHHSFRPLATVILKLAHDWCHVRRKYEVAEKTFAAEAGFMLDKIRVLFAIEEQIKGRPPDKVLEIRQAFSKPVIAEIREFLDGQHALPESSLGKAHRYTNRLWPGLTVFLDNPAVPLHTNGIEGALRQPAVGRRNHFGSKTLETAQVAAVWYSVIATCRQHQVPTREYLIATLRAILTKQPVVMPWDWARTTH